MIDFGAARTAMVDRQVRTADVTRLPIIAAMLAVPRERFVPRASRAIAYADAAIDLGEGRALMEPRTFAKLLDAADIGSDDLVLDVGSATGYSAAVIARFAAAVVALEQDEAFAASAAATLTALDIDNVIHERGPLTEGAPEAGPYDVILLEGAVARPPETLLRQLKDGGRLVAVVAEGPVGQARVFTRSGEGWSSRRAFDATANLLPGFDVAPQFEF